MLNAVLVGARIVLGLIYFIFGGMGLLLALGVMPMQTPPMTEGAETFFKGIMAAGYFFPLLKATETVCGFLLLVNFGTPLALVVLAPITLNIILFHACLTPGAGNQMLPAAMGMLQILAMSAQLKHYRPLFTKN